MHEIPRPPLFKGTCLIVGCVLVAIVWCSYQRLNVGGTLREVVASSFRQTEKVTLENQTAIDFQHSDPILTETSTGWKVVGSVVQSTPKQIQIVWYDPLLVPSENSFRAYETPHSLTWVATTLLPEEKRRILAAELVRRLQENQTELTATLEPLLVQSLRDLLPIIQERLQESLQKHQLQWQLLAEKYRESLVKEKLVPLVKSEIMPILQSDSKELLSQIGIELFEKVSLLRFTWRYLYDVSPLPQRDLVKREFDRFMRDEGIPVIEKHMDEILSTMKRSIQHVSENAEVRRVAAEASSEMFHDPELRAILSETLRDVFEDPQPMRDAIRKNWEGESGIAFGNAVSKVVDPWLRQAGEELFGTDRGLTPELISVLRSQILAKDQRWMVVATKPRSGSFAPKGLSVQTGTGLPRFPLLVEMRNTEVPAPTTTYNRLESSP